MDLKKADDLYTALKEFIENLYFRYLAVNPKDRKVVIVESIFCPTHFRKTLARVLFQHFDVSFGVSIVCTKVYYDFIPMFRFQLF